MSLSKLIISSIKNPHFQSLFGNGLIAVFGMVTVAILFRALSINDIGIYLFFITIMSLVDSIRAGFLTNSFIKFYSGSDLTRANEVVGSAWGLATIITFISVMINVGTFFLSPYVQNEGAKLFFTCFSLITLVTLPSFMAGLILQGNKRFDRLLWIKLINQLIFTGTVIILTFLKKANLISIVATYILANLIASLFALFVGWTRFMKIRFFSKRVSLEIFHFGKYSLGTSISSNLFHVTDTFFINFLLGPSALAVYNLGGKLLQIIEIPLLSIATSGMSSLSNLYNKNKNDEMIYLMNKIVGVFTWAIFGMAILSIIFAEPIIGLIGGEKYIHTEAPHLFRIFMSIAILYPADRFFAITLDVIHMPKVNFYKIIIMLIINVIGDYLSLLLFKSIYAITIISILPTLAAIMISYPPLKKYYNFSFWRMYYIGYKETILFIRHFVNIKGSRNI